MQRQIRVSIDSKGQIHGTPLGKRIFLMQQESRLQEILESIKRTYGSLDDPNYSFAEKRYRSLLRHPFVLSMMKTYHVLDQTDLNDHVALHLEILHKDGSMLICLSCVDSWVMIFRLETQHFPEVKILEASSDLLPAERDVVDMLFKHGFKQITREEASTRIDMNLCDTDRSEARLYHALISDDGTLPFFLLD
jgi:hypothetical protein